MALPQLLDWKSFDDVHDDVSRWPAELREIAAEHGSPVVEPITEGSVLVARIAGARILKLYPPFLRDHFDFECAMLELVHGRLSVPTPQRLAIGERDGWPYIVMTQLHGDALTASWKVMDEPERCALLRAIGGLINEVHALPVESLRPLAPRREDFVVQQRERCHGRQQRTKLPEHLLARLAPFIAGELPQGPDVPLTGEYTPFNLFTRAQRLAAMFDFGDGLVGPREYDWLGPLCFFAAGHAPRVAALFEGLGVQVDEAKRLSLLRLLLLHKYSSLRGQIACTGWQESPDFDALAERIWPFGG